MITQMLVSNPGC